MKKIMAVLAALCIIVSPSAKADEGYIFDSGMIMGVEDVLSTEEELVIPEEINGRSVEIIYSLESANAKRIVLPASVRVVCKNAFSGCPSLENVSLDNVKLIYGGAFDGCAALKSISSEQGNTLPKGCIIGNEAFKGCGLEGIFIKEDISLYQGYGEGAFRDCVNLKNISIGENVTDLGNGIFEGCSSIEYINIPRNIDRLHDGAFKNCTDLRTVIFPAKNVEIYSREGHSGIFEGCEKLTIFGMAGSTAEKYAAEHQIPFIPSVITEREQSSIIGYTECTEMVSVNGMKIPSYNINGSIYIGEKVLECLGFEFKWNKAERKTEVFAPENVSWEVEPSGNLNPYGICFFSTDVSFVYQGRVIPAINVGNGESIIDINALAGKKLY